MFKYIAVLLFIVPYALMADFDYRVENTNISISQDLKNTSSQFYNYDRLRFRGDYTKDEFFSTIIVDGVNYYANDYIQSSDFEYIKSVKSDTPFSTTSNYHDYNRGSTYAKVYRLYLGYQDEKNRALVGLINVSMGVGRIWNPTNLFNPKNTYALEPDEVFGVAGVSYTRHINNTSSLSVVTSQKADKTLKYAGIYKSFLEFADIGISIISSDETKMIGYEIEANLFDTGIELRSEGAYIKNDTEFFQGILGADYGFVNGVTIIGEVLYSSKKFSFEEQLLNSNSEISQNLVHSNLYTALSLSYSFNIFLDSSLLYIESYNDDNSRFISPSLTYTLNDYNSFVLSAMLQDGSTESEFGRSENSYFFKWSCSF